MSDQDEGPNGEKSPAPIPPHLNQQGLKDPDTGYPLPVRIGNVPIPNNFRSSRPVTWPVGLGRDAVTKWILSHHSDDQSLPEEFNSPPVGDEQPVAPDAPVKEDGFRDVKAEEALAASVLDTSSRLISIDERLERIEKMVSKISPTSLR